MKTAAITGSIGGIMGFGGSATVGLSYTSGSQSRTNVPVSLTFGTKGGLGGFQGGICVNTLLDGETKNLLNSDGVGEEAWRAQKDKFKNPQGKAEGCVAVSWNRSIGGNDRWGGEIRYEWLFTKGHETIVFTGFLDTTDAKEKNWRAIYLDTREKKKAWRMWTIRSPHMPKKPAFSAIKEDIHPDWTRVCLLDSCLPTQRRDQYSNRWRWKEGEVGGQPFSAWSNFSEITEGEDSLPELRKLMEQMEGTWESF